jgi:hypothetical protein
MFGKIRFISPKHQLPAYLPKKNPHLSILTTLKMTFPRLFDVLNILVLFLGASALRTWKHCPSSTSHASFTIDMLPDRPRLSYLSPAQLIHEVATVVSQTLQRDKFPETISRIEKYKKLERTPALQGLDREKIAGMIWETYEREVEKLKGAEKRKREWTAKGREEPKRMKRKEEAGAFLKRLVGGQEKQLWKAMKETEKGKQELLYVRIPRRVPWIVKDR